jgi:diadenosine tetraphosphate (Ap4A) HIT family hydrolase
MMTTGMSCIFCQYILERAGIDYLGEVAILRDEYPVTEGHCLVVPQRHVTDIFALKEDELADLARALRATRERLLEADPSIAGFNLGTNAGKAAGQTVEHAHVHVIPRREGDTADPAGGIRAVIPSRKTY